MVRPEQDKAMLPPFLELMSSARRPSEMASDVLYASICPFSLSMTLHSCGHFVKYSR